MKKTCPRKHIIDTPEPKKRRTPRDDGTRGRGRGGRKLFTENVGHGVYHCPRTGKTIFNPGMPSEYIISMTSASSTRPIVQSTNTIHTPIQTISSQPPAPNKPSQTLASPPFQQGHAGWMRDGLAYNPNGRTGVTAAQLKKMLPKRGGRSMGTDRAIGSVRVHKSRSPIRSDCMTIVFFKII